MSVILHTAEREGKTSVLGGLQLHWIIGSSIAVNDFFLYTNMNVKFSLVHGYVSLAQYSTLQRCQRYLWCSWCLFWKLWSYVNTELSTGWLYQWQLDAWTWLVPQALNRLSSMWPASSQSRASELRLAERSASIKWYFYVPRLFFKTVRMTGPPEVPV